MSIVSIALVTSQLRRYSTLQQVYRVLRRFLYLQIECIIDADQNDLEIREENGGI